MVLLVPIGAVVSAQRPSPVAVLAASLTLATATVLFTYINIQTDAALDRALKPELSASLGWHRPLTRAVMAGLILVVLGGLAWLVALQRPAAATALLIAIACGVLYSYNFLPLADPIRDRFKTRWWTHAVAFVGGYLAMMLAGFLCGAEPRTWPDWLPLFAAVAFGDYALILCECSLDDEEERAAGLQTAAALLGRNGSFRAALAVTIAATTALVSFHLRMPRILLAFAPTMIARAVLLFWMYSNSCRSFPWLLDATFWLARMISLVLLLIS